MYHITYYVVSAHQPSTEWAVPFPRTSRVLHTRGTLQAHVPSGLCGAMLVLSSSAWCRSTRNGRPSTPARGYSMFERRECAFTEITQVLINAGTEHAVNYMAYLGSGGSGCVAGR